MSRIHEALKKAEQDKSENQVDRKLEEPANLLSSRQAVKIAAEAEIVLAPVRPADSRAAGSEILQLDELLTKCVKTAWNPDLNFLVFSNAKEFPAGAEQFRTLRARLYRIRDSD